MKKYLVISRKFRPQRFSDVFGQEGAVHTLMNALRSGKIANAYLFTGTRGTGKTTLARIFAKALNCKNLEHKTAEPCNECPSCLEILSGQSLDVLEIDGASHRGIDDIRAINDTVIYAPSNGKYKIYIIDEVHMLTKEAFNALLKTLEEPPEQVKFFFATTEPHKVLPTILSRCQRFDLKRIPSSLIVEKLGKVAKDLSRTIEEAALQKIALFAEGSLRDAESLLEQILCFEEGEITERVVDSALGFTPNSLFFDLDRAFYEENLSFAFTLTEQIYHSGKDFGSFLTQLSEHYRHLLLCKRGISPTSAGYRQSSDIYTEEECLFILDLIMEAIHRSQKSFQRIHLEMLLLHIIRSKKRVSLDAVATRLFALEKKLSSPSAEKIKQEEVPPPASTPILKQEEEVSLQPVPILAAPLPQAPTTQKEEETISLQPIPFSLSSPPSPAPKQQEEVSLQPPPISAAPPPPSPVIQKEEKKVEAAAPQKTAKHDTLLRFASVELEGTLK